jgi:MFS family permease
MAMAVLVGFVVERHGLAAATLLKHFAPWQLMFFAVGAPTVVAAFMFALFVREPTRVKDPTAGPESATLREAGAFLKKNARLYVGLILGCGLNTLGSAAMGSWGPQLLKRGYGWRISDAGLAIGAILAAAGVVGYLILPPLSEAVRNRRANPDLPILMAMAMSLFGSVLFAAAPLAPTAWMFLSLWGLGAPMISASGMLAITSIPVIAPPRMRAVIAAIFLMVASALVLAVGPTLAAALAALLFADRGVHALADGVAAVCAITPVLTLSLLTVARRPYATTIDAHLNIRGAGGEADSNVVPLTAAAAE